MRLVELLARELDEWPEYDHFQEILCITQDDDMATNLWEYFDPHYYGGAWGYPKDTPVDYLEINELATDHATAIVTRKMWEDERERIKRDMYSGSITTKPQWRGPEDGLPPAGTMVMFRNHECEVVGHHDGVVVCAMDDDYENGCYDGFSARDLRPIDTRTPREKWIEAAAQEWRDGNPIDTMGAIYDTMIAKLPEDWE